MQRLFIICLLCCPSGITSAQTEPNGTAELEKAAKSWYCDPINGSTPTSARDVGKGNGSKEKPWGTLDSVVRARLINGADSSKGTVHAGDTIKLMTGNHGAIKLAGPECVNASMITVEAEDEQTPVLQNIIGTSIKNWTFRNLHFVTPSPAPQWFYQFRIIDSSHVTFSDNDLRSCKNVDEWTMDDWLTKTPHFSVWASGSDITISDNTIYACNNGINISGTKFEVVGNTIDCFTNDGMNVTADNSLIARNRITNQFETLDDGHHDGIQCFELKGLTRENLTIRDNYIAKSTGEYKTIPALTEVDPAGLDVLQGISIFDGAWKHLQVVNNVVCVTAYNGITLMGTEDSTVSNNTVISQSNLISRITFRDRKDGVKTHGGVCENNIAPMFSIPLTGVTLKNNFSFEKPGAWWGSTNFTVVDPAKTFRKYGRDKAKFDFAIRDDSPVGKKLIRNGKAGAQQ